ncbi:MAG: hypothetical protein IT365_05255 [Candidatus Hydrogenedentes bacterium]|nr:hypothetical protein [Candidatus Hydrogenedentota bacterium]
MFRKLFVACGMVALLVGGVAGCGGSSSEEAGETRIDKLEKAEGAGLPMSQRDKDILEDERASAAAGEAGQEEAAQ